MRLADSKKIPEEPTLAQLLRKLRMERIAFGTLLIAFLISVWTNYSLLQRRCSIEIRIEEPFIIEVPRDLYSGEEA